MNRELTEKIFRLPHLMAPEFDNMLCDVPIEIYRKLGDDGWHFLLDLFESAEQFSSQCEEAKSATLWCLERLSQESNGFDMGVVSRCEEIVKNGYWNALDSSVLMGALCHTPFYYREDSVYTRLSSLCEWFLAHRFVPAPKKTTDWPLRTLWKYSKKSYEYFPRFSKYRFSLLENYYSGKIVIAADTLSSIFQGPNAEALLRYGFTSNQGSPFIESACFSTDDLIVAKLSQGARKDVLHWTPVYDRGDRTGDLQLMLRFSWLMGTGIDEFKLLDARLLE